MTRAGLDFNASVKEILNMRRCGSDAKSVRDLVTFHLFYDQDHSPKHVMSQEEIRRTKVKCLTETEELVEIKRKKRIVSYRNEMNLDYYVNVARQDNE